ncbi:LPXTG cell wall anchor domain-containing protein [Streptomyces sp. NPDC004732]|uniref:LPXTG cell wall anchor domain-containing protein n=1 Tax=Streptomyces sp. NPDC004732 TaxID=3154290 RepID=UPI0033AA0106
MSKHSAPRKRTLAKIALVGAGASMLLATPAMAATAQPDAESSILDGIDEPDTDASNLKEFDKQREQYDKEAQKDKVSPPGPEVLPPPPEPEVQPEKPEIIEPGPDKPQIVPPGPALPPPPPEPEGDKDKPVITPPGPELEKPKPDPDTKPLTPLTPADKIEDGKDKPKPEEGKEDCTCLKPADKDKHYEDCASVKPDKQKPGAVDKGAAVKPVSSTSDQADATTDVVTPKGGVAAGAELAATGSDGMLVPGLAAASVLVAGAGLVMAGRRKTSE